MASLPLMRQYNEAVSRVPGEQQDTPTIGLGGFGEGWLWSSSQNNNNNAWNQKFSDGRQDNNNKNNNKSVRACRALERSCLRHRQCNADAGGISLHDS